MGHGKVFFQITHLRNFKTMLESFIKNTRTSGKINPVKYGATSTFHVTCEHINDLHN